MSIGLKIKEFRKKRGLTQKQLGSRCGIADSNIRKYESGIQRPKIETLRKIADALNTIVIENNGQFDLIEKGQTIIKHITHITQNDLLTYPDLDRKLSDYIKELFISYQGADSPITNHFPDELSARCEIYNTVLHHVDIKVQNGFAIYDIYPLLASPSPFDPKENCLLEKYSKLNNKGPDKLIEYANDLSQIPEYQKNFTNPKEDPELLAAHARIDVKQTSEGVQHDLDIMNNNSEWD